MGDEPSLNSVPPGRAGSGRTLRSRWGRLLVVLAVALSIGLASSVLGARYLVSSSRSAAEQIERQATSFSELRSGIASHARLARASLSADGPSAAEVVQTTNEVDASFTRALAEAAEGSTTSQFLERARDEWASVARTLNDPELVPVADGGADVGQGFQNVLELLDQATAATLEASRSDLRNAHRVEQAVLAGMAGVGVVVLLSLFTLARRFDREVLEPIAGLRDSAMALGTGDRAHRVEVIADNELGDLAIAFNTMADSIGISERRLVRQAHTDSLTRLANRTGFHDRLVQALDPGNGPAVSTVLFVDLDDFKLVNDSLGHQSGDEVLRVVASRLSGAVRGPDVVVRLGGDEFAVLLEGRSPELSDAVAERIVTVLHEPIDVHDTRVVLGASVGVAGCQPGMTVEEVMHNADSAMYRAKSGGKNRFERFRVQAI